MPGQKLSVTAKLLIFACVMLYFVSIWLAYYKGKMDGMQLAVFQRYDKATAAVGEKYDVIKGAGKDVALRTIELGTSAVTFWRKSPEDPSTTAAPRKPALLSRVFHRDKATSADAQTTGST